MKYKIPIFLCTVLNTAFGAAKSSQGELKSFSAALFREHRRLLDKVTD
ncbi:hypothetical protein [Marinomonas algicola]|nr:hypothetical protein [Marinomonas algicola]